MLKSITSTGLLYNEKMKRTVKLKVTKVFKQKVTTEILSPTRCSDCGSSGTELTRSEAASLFMSENGSLNQFLEANDLHVIERSIDGFVICKKSLFQYLEKSEKDSE